MGGEKVHPAEVESVLLQMPGITDAVAFAKPNAITGQVVAVKVVASAEADKQTIRAFCEGRLARHKIPRVVEFVESVSGERHKRVRRDR